MTWTLKSNIQGPAGPGGATGPSGSPIPLMAPTSVTTYVALMTWISTQMNTYASTTFECRIAYSQISADHNLNGTATYEVLYVYTQVQANASSYPYATMILTNSYGNQYLAQFYGSSGSTTATTVTTTGWNLLISPYPMISTLQIPSMIGAVPFTMANGVASWSTSTPQANYVLTWSTSSGSPIWAAPTTVTKSYATISSASGFTLSSWYIGAGLSGTTIVTPLGINGQGTIVTTNALTSGTKYTIGTAASPYNTGAGATPAFDTTGSYTGQLSYANGTFSFTAGKALAAGATISGLNSFVVF
jgi:hypothetical protein